MAEDLLSLNGNRYRRDALEIQLFGPIDTKGSIARRTLFNDGPEKLTSEQRCDFARFLLSLEARRPKSVTTMRVDGSRFLAEALDCDDELLRAMKDEGRDGSPSDHVESILGTSLENRALLQIQALVDNREVGERLINMLWAVKRLDGSDGSLVLSDRPLIRVHGFDHPKSTWVLPLDPHTAFVACADAADMTAIMKTSGSRFVKAVNTSSAVQAERYVFCVDETHERWLGKYLKEA